MPNLQIAERNLHYVDYGKGQPIILIHGWPLSHQSWEYQIKAIVEAGFRCIAYDRKGFGKSDASWENYDYNSLAADVHEIISQLHLKKVVLIGFSMGGGEVIRYLTNYGSENISKIALIASIIPLIKQKNNNPNGVPQKELEGIIQSLKKDRLAFLNDFHKGFYNYNDNKEIVSQQQLAFDFSVASHAAPQATLLAAQAWMDTDFREECKKVAVPTLIIHGDADNTVPQASAADQAAELIPNNTYKIYKKAPHGLNITHKEQLNADIIQFLTS